MKSYRETLQMKDTEPLLRYHLVLNHFESGKVKR